MRNCTLIAGTASLLNSLIKTGDAQTLRAKMLRLTRSLGASTLIDVLIDFEGGMLSKVPWDAVAADVADAVAAAAVAVVVVFDADRSAPGGQN